MAADMRYNQPELGGSRRLAKETAHIVAHEEADPVDVRLAGARRIGRRAAIGAAVLGVGAAAAVVANEAFDNSPSFQREKNSHESVPANGNDGAELHVDPTQVEVSVTPKSPKAE